MKVVANLSRRGHSQRNLWIISWCLAHTQLLAPALLRAAMATVVPEMITNSRGERDRDFALFTERVDGAGKRWLLRATTDRCQEEEALQGGISIAFTTEEAKQGEQECWAPKEVGSKKEGFPCPDKYTSYPISPSALQ